MSLTIDRNDERLNKEKLNGQNEVYLVLSDKELAKGFIRPYRDSYIHVGRKLHYKEIHEILSEEAIKEMKEKGYYSKPYVAIMTALTDEDGKYIGGSYVTQEELDAWKQGIRIGGCGTLTKMNKTISETYAVKPKFYSATFCCGCGKHLPVEEFTWDGTNEEVGS